MIIMPPSSITVSIITAEEKMKMEKDKSLMLTGNHDLDNKRPSLEIMRVNGPPTSNGTNVDPPKPSSPSAKPPKEQNEESPRPKTKKPVPAVIPIKSAKPSITITPQSRSSPNSSNGKQEEIKSSVTISLENGSQSDAALDLSGKSSRKDVVGSPQQQQQYPVASAVKNHVNGGSGGGGGGGQYEPSGMRNLMTLSDTAVHVRNMQMSSSQLSSSKEQSQEANKKRFNHHHHNNNNNNNNNSCTNDGGSCSPKRPNGSVPLRIPVPPSSGSFKTQSPQQQQQQQQQPHKPAAKAAVSSSRGGGAGASDQKPKHGPPNQAVRHIPNPSVLLFRHHQHHLAQFAAAAAANAAAAAAAGNHSKRPTTISSVSATAAPVPPRMNPHPMPAAIPLHTIRKMENMTKNIEKVAAGLSVKANALYK